MNCPSLEELALFGGGDQPLTDGMRRHLKECPACAAVAADFSSDSLLLRTAPEVSDAAVAEVRESVMERVRPRRRLWWVAAAVTAGLGILAFPTHWPSDIPLLVTSVRPPVVITPLPMIAKAAPAPAVQKHRIAERTKSAAEVKYNALLQLEPPEVSKLIVLRYLGADGPDRPV